MGSGAALALPRACDRKKWPPVATNDESPPSFDRSCAASRTARSSHPAAAACAWIDLLVRGNAVRATRSSASSARGALGGCRDDAAHEDRVSQAIGSDSRVRGEVRAASCALFGFTASVRLARSRSPRGQHTVLCVARTRAAARARGDRDRRLRRREEGRERLSNVVYRDAIRRILRRGQARQPRDRALRHHGAQQRDGQRTTCATRAAVRGSIRPLMGGMRMRRLGMTWWAACARRRWTPRRSTARSRYTRARGARRAG